MEMYRITTGVKKTVYYGTETGQDFSEVICGKLHYTKEAGLVNIPKGQLAWGLMGNTADRSIALTLWTSSTKERIHVLKSSDDSFSGLFLIWRSP